MKYCPIIVLIYILCSQSPVACQALSEKPSDFRHDITMSGFDFPVYGKDDQLHWIASGTEPRPFLLPPDSINCAFIDCSVWTLPMKFTCNGQKLPYRSVRELLRNDEEARRKLSTGRSLVQFGYLAMIGAAGALTYLEIKYGSTKDEEEKGTSYMNAPTGDLLLYGVLPMVIGATTWVIGGYMIQNAINLYNAKMGYGMQGVELKYSISFNSIGIKIYF
jgi:hypothetical protein